MDMINIIKISLLLLISLLSSLDAKEARAMAIFEEDGVSKYIYSNSYSIKKDNNITKQKIKKSDRTKEDLWLWFEDVSKSVLGMGEFVSYRFNIENGSGKKIEDIVIAITLPEGFRYVDNSCRVDNSSNLVKRVLSKEGKLFLTLDSLDKESSRAVEFTLQVGVISTKKATIKIDAKADDINANSITRTILLKDMELMRDKSTIVGRVSADGKPVENVRLYMEDGTFTLTDEHGEYNFAGIERGTHVVKLDRDSLDEIYTIGSCEESVQSAGDQDSQFIKTLSGTLHRSDFCLNIKDKKEEEDQFGIDTKEVFMLENQSQKMPQYDEEWLSKENDKFEFVWPSESYIPSTSAVNIVVKHNEKHLVTYLVNGKVVDPVHFDKKLTDEKGKALTIYKGVHLKEGDNSVVCQIKDDLGNLVDEITKKIHYSGMPVRAKVITEYSNLVADGKHIPVIAVKFFDRDGYPVHADIVGKFKISQPYRGYRRLDATGQNPLSKSSTGEDYVIVDGGMAYIKLEATTKAGEATLSLPFANRTEELKVWLKPKVRDWILVGFAEGSVGYKTISQNMKKEKIESDKEISLFAKGRVLGSYLMTIAYSNKERERELMDIIDPNRYYTIYGDSSVRGVEAPTQKRLYFKIEKDNFYGMFGDFVTGLNDMKLSNYDRTLNGLKSEYKGERVQATIFGSNSDQSFVKDEIRGDGTSGLYRLSHQKIIINSEKIRLETRDRYQPDRVLKQESLSALEDYNIDYFKGTIYFKRPIFSRDQNFNPIYIVVNYEVKSSGDSLSAGARVSVNMLDEKMKLSSTYIKEDLGEQKAQLAAIDMRLRVGERGKLEAEYAKSSKSQIADQKSAMRIEYEHNGENLYAKGYYKKIEREFGLKQQNAEDLDLEKIGVESGYRLNNRAEAKATLYRDKTISTGDINDVVESSLYYDLKTVHLEGGARYINDHKSKPTEQLIAGISKTLFDNRLTLRAKREESIQTNDSEQFPNRTLLGAEVEVTDRNTIFIEEELIDGSKKIDTTRVGVSSELWSGTTIHTSLNEKIGDGDRLFSLVGIQQSIALNDTINIDLGLDRADTINGEIDDDFVAYSSSLNYCKNSVTSSLKVEYKQTDEEDAISLAMALAMELNSSLELATSAQYFKSNSGDESIYADISMAYRPQESDYIILDKFHFVDERERALSSRKFVNDFNINYKVVSSFELSIYYGIKQIIEKINDSKYSGIIQMVGLLANYHLNKKFDLMLYTNTIDGGSTLNQQRYNHGIALGWNVYKNVNLIAGYNFEGFEDRDFDALSKTKKGAYIGFEMKF